MRRAGLAVAVAAALLAAGCSSSGSDHADDPVVSSPAGSSAGATSAAAPSTPAATAPSSAPATSSGPATSSAPTRPPLSSSTAPPPARSTCTKIGIRVIEGGASVGQEISALQFTNEGGSSCELVGYPSVTLLRHGSPLGRASEPSTTAVSARTLAPGAVAESLLHDYVTNCQAPLSESIRVVAPGSTVSLVRPFQLRACVIRVDQLGAPE